MCPSSLQLVTVGEGLAGARRGRHTRSRFAGCKLKATPGTPKLLAAVLLANQKKLCWTLEGKATEDGPLTGQHLTDLWSLTESCPVTVPGAPPHSLH